MLLKIDVLVLIVSQRIAEAKRGKPLKAIHVGTCCTVMFNSYNINDGRQTINPHFNFGIDIVKVLDIPLELVLTLVCVCHGMG